MRTLAIRELDAPTICQAAQHDQVIGITNGRVLAGVLVPISRDWVHQLIEGHFSRIVQNIRRGEREVATVLDAADDPTDLPPAATFTTLTDVLRQPPPPAGLALDQARQVSLRDISGRVLEEAAQRDEPIVLTTDRVVAGVIFPVSQSLVIQLVEQNLSRILYNIQAGEKELDTGTMTTLDDALR
jgi:hypothetical protein